MTYMETSMHNAQLVKLTFPDLNQDHPTRSYLATYSDGYVRKDSELLFVVQDAPNWVNKPIKRHIHGIYANHEKSDETLVIEAIH